MSEFLSNRPFIFPRLRSISFNPSTISPPKFTTDRKICIDTQVSHFRKLEVFRPTFIFAAFGVVRWTRSGSDDEFVGLGFPEATEKQNWKTICLTNCIYYAADPLHFV